MIYRETSAAYHEREAVSASFLWDGIKPGGCWAKAWHHSIFNPDWREVRARSDAKRNQGNLDFGVAFHAFVLEPELFDDKTRIITGDDWRSRKAQDLRREAYEAGKAPILERDLDVIISMDKSLKASPAGQYFTQLGDREISYTWSHDGVECKARADLIIPEAIIDLKSAEDASEEGFKRAMARDGHHLRAAWYSNGLVLAEGGDPWDYIFIVVEKSDPYLVGVYQCDDRAMEWARRLIHKALSEIKLARETNVWPGYAQGSSKISLPSFVEYNYADLEAIGEL